MGNTAIFGGTFNPIHSEHIKMIKHLSSLEFIDRILVIPTHIPPHKSASYLASDEDRLNMCSMAVEGIEKVQVSDFEIERKGKSYTFYTVEALKKKYRDEDFFVVCGGDMAITLDTWHRYEELKKLCTFLVIDRPGTNRAELTAYLNSLMDQGAKIICTDCPTDDVSSTNLRKQLKEFDANINIPKKVMEYIKEKGLYINE